MLHSLRIQQGNDGNVYFFAMENYDYQDWKYLRGTRVSLRDSTVVVQVENARDYTQDDAERLLFAYLKGKQSGTISTYRLD